MMWKCHYDGLVHEVLINHRPNNLDSPGTRVGLRCGIDMYYTLQMAVTRPEEVPTTCIGCIAYVVREAHAQNIEYIREKRMGVAMAEAFVNAVNRLKP